VTNASIVSFDKKNQFYTEEKLSVAFDGAMPSVYENDIFPTVSCAAVEIYEKKQQIQQK